MLSSKVIKSVAKASHYYSQQDNYYTRDEGIEQSEWWGKGAEKLALFGQVDAKMFTDLLAGKLPMGEQLGKVVDGKMQHRPGWDLTFSAPKSVSLMAYIGGDKRLIEAHRQAVSMALTYIERSSAQARIKTPEGMAYQNTGNIVAALYHHDLSRAKDPQMHTHSVVMNMTERLDGNWRSLASKMGSYTEESKGVVNGFIERVRHHNRFLSKLYETELAYRVSQLGYEITTDTKSGKFEIVGVSTDAIQCFSKRRGQIEEKLKQKGLSGGKAAAVAALDDRAAKEKVDRAALKEQWNQEAKNSGLDCQKVITSIYQQDKTNSMDKQSITAPAHVLDVISQTAKSLSVFQTTFMLEEIIMEASDYAIHHHINIESLLAGVDTQIQNGELILLPDERGKTVLMAKSTLDDEKQLISHLKDNQSPDKKVSDVHLTHYLAQHEEIAPEYHEPLKTIFGHDRIVLVEGKAAKEALAATIISIAKSADLNVTVLSPSLVGSKQFAKEIKPAPQTFWEHIKALFVEGTPKHYSIMQFLSTFNESNPPTNQNETPDVLVVDNAHLLSTNQKANLAEWNKVHHSKLILLGNKETLLPQFRGTSIAELTEHGVQSVSVVDKKNTVDGTSHDAIRSAVSKMAGRIIEVKQDDDRYHAMGIHYAHLSEHDRRQSWLVGQSKQAVEELNSIAHYELVANNKINQVRQFNVLFPVFLPEGKAAVASSYQKDQRVRFNDTYSSLNIERGEYLRVVSHHEKSNCVVLEKSDGDQVIWYPDKVAGTTRGKVELFNEKERALGRGDSIVFQRSIKAREIVKGERFFITAIHKQKIQLKNNEGKSVILDLTKPYHRHIDYGYAATPHAIAHEKPNFLIADLPGKAFQVDQRRFYQTISQPKEAWIYTDNQQGLVAHLEKKTGDRLNAHETIAKAVELKKNLHSLYDVLEKQLVQAEGINQPSVLNRKAVEAIDYAMRHLAEREAGFTHKDLLEVAMKHAIGHVTQAMLMQTTIEMQKAGILLRATRSDGTLWTTAEAVKIEREILSLITRDKGTLQPIVSDELISKYCDPAVLRPEQIAAIKAITQSTDRVLSVQGRAGTGKTTMMVTLADVLGAKELLTDSGYSLFCLAPTHKGVKELRSRGLTAQTVDSFLLDMRRIQENKISHDYSKTILVVDEASMVSNRNMQAVLKVGHDFNFRGMISTGDTEQNPSIEAGKPHDLIQNQLDTTIYLQDIQRQKNPILKKAVKAIYQGDINKTFAVLNHSIKEINAKVNQDPGDSELKPDDLNQKYYQKRIEAIVSDYISLLEKGDNVQIIAPSHQDRKVVNEEVRHQLEKLNLLKGENHSFSILSSKDMTGVERSEAVNFKAGQILRFSIPAGKAIKAGDYFTIKNINPQHNMLTLAKTGCDKEVLWQIPRQVSRINNMVEVFHREDRMLKVGDKIVWTRTNRKEGTLSTDFAEVTHIEQKLITAKRQDNSTFIFDGQDEKYQHWDHAYAITTYGSQGGTYSTILALFESYRHKLMNLKNLLVTITRPENDLRIYTDDKEKLKAAIQNNTGSKMSSLEVIGQYPTKQHNKIPVKAVAQLEENGQQTNQDKKTPARKISSKNKENALPYRDKYSVERIKEGLNRDAEKIAIAILGEPKIRGSHFIKFGSNQGSLSVTTKGEKQGWWHDFSDGGGRSMLSFIQKYAGLDKQQALEYGAKWVGIYPSLTDRKENLNIKKSDEKTNSESNKKWKNEQKNKIEFAKKLAGQSQAIKGTLAERYLQEHRAITMDTYPDDIRFHPGIYSKLNGKTLPALLVIARDKSDQIQAVQATYLDQATAQKMDKSTVTIQKQTFGLLQGATVTIRGDKGAPTLIAEGTETGLSLAKSIDKVNVKITLGKANFKHINSKALTEKVIFCLDNDGKDIKEDKLIHDAAKRVAESNKQVAFMLPTSLNEEKQDYNDVLKQAGEAAIQRDFEQAISYADRYETTQNSMANSFTLHQKIIMHEKSSLTILAKNVNHQRQLISISNKTISNITRQSLKNNHQQDIKNIENYQSITPQKEVAKAMPTIKDIELEI